MFSPEICHPGNWKYAKWLLWFCFCLLAFFFLIVSYKTQAFHQPKTSWIAFYCYLVGRAGQATIPVFSLSCALFSLTCRHPVIDLLEWHAMGHQAWVFKFVQMSDLCWCFFCSVLLFLLLWKGTAGQCWLYSSVSCWPLNHQGLQMFTFEFQKTA